MDHTVASISRRSARAEEHAGLLREDSPIRSAQLYPLPAKPEGFVGSARQVSVYDPKTKKWAFIDTCFGSHHFNFAEDADNTLFLTMSARANSPLLGWVNTRKFCETGDAAQWQGWTPLIVDTNGDGKRSESYNEPGAPIDPAKDTRVPYGLYSVAWSPLDGSVWGSNLTFPGYAVRDCARRNPPETALTEIYKVPPPGYGIRGADVDRNGVFWAALGSGHLASFDRRKCRGPLNGAGAEKGEKCSEGWSFYPFPGPGFRRRCGRGGDAVLRMGRPARYFRARRQHALRHRQSIRRIACAGWRQLRRAACPLPNGLLCEGN